MEFLENAVHGDFTVWHDGSNVLSCSSGKDVTDYMAYILNLYLDGDPRLVVDEVLDTRTESGGKYILIMYEYIDKCREFFLVECN